MVDRAGIEPADKCLQNTQEPQLNHSPLICLAEVLGIEPRIRESKSRVIPFHHTPTEIFPGVVYLVIITRWLNPGNSTFW